MHYEATESLYGEAGGQAEVTGNQRVMGRLVKDGIKTRLQIRRPANDRVGCKKIGTA